MDTSLRHAIGESIKAFRKARGISQEELGPSQSYMSELERGVKKNASIMKIDQIGAALDTHPVSLIAAAYRLSNPDINTQELLKRIERELAEIQL